MISINVVTLLYLVASVCFIQALKGLSHPTTSRIGNAFGMAGMVIGDMHQITGKRIIRVTITIKYLVTVVDGLLDV